MFLHCIFTLCIFTLYFSLSVLYHTVARMSDARRGDVDVITHVDERSARVIVRVNVYSRVHVHVYVNVDARSRARSPRERRNRGRE